FPTDTFGSANYWVDVLFSQPAADTTPPTVTTTTPPAGATGVAVSTNATATFSESVQSSTISFTLTGPGNTPVPGALTYDDASKTATLNPNADLSPGVTYTASVSGAKDLAGNTMTAPVTWSFTTFSSTTTAYPSSVVVLTGTTRSGSAANLASDDGSYFQVNSAVETQTITSWYGVISNVPNAIGSLTVDYDGQNQRACTQTISLWRWTDSKWIQLDKRSVGPSDVSILGLTATGTLSDYVDGTTGNGDVRV